MNIVRDLKFLHPEFRRAVNLLDQHLTRSYKAGVTKTLFKIFETYRDPLRQEDLITKGVTKAGMFQSAHQFGLAADFVPFLTPLEADTLAQDLGERVFPGWNWSAAHDYSFLAAAAKSFDLRTPISWDPCHVQHPFWDNLREIYNNI